jgi:hypothetical protein
VISDLRDWSDATGSESVDLTIGTASDEPRLPISTQTLRATPAPPARRMAGPLENESRTASASATSSRSMSAAVWFPEARRRSPARVPRRTAIHRLRVGSWRSIRNPSFHAGGKNLQFLLELEYRVCFRHSQTCPPFRDMKKSPPRLVLLEMEFA